MSSTALDNILYEIIGDLVAVDSIVDTREERYPGCCNILLKSPSIAQADAFQS